MGKLKQLAQAIDEKGTKVIFRQFADGDIIAIFPEIPADNNYNHCLSYQHTGQHGTCDVGIYHDTFKPYTGKIEPLIRELTAIGYKLQIVRRISYKMDQNRIAEIKRTVQP